LTVGDGTRGSLTLMWVNLTNVWSHADSKNIMPSIHIFYWPVFWLTVRTLV